MAIADTLLNKALDAAEKAAAQKSAKASIRATNKQNEKQFAKYAGEDFQSDVSTLKKKLEQDAIKAARGEKTFFKSPQEAQAYWDKIYDKLSKNMLYEGRSIGPASDKITYKMPDGKFVTRRNTDPAPEGAERISLTHQQLRDLMPPRPHVPGAEAPPAPPHSYQAGVRDQNEKVQQILAERRAAAAAPPPQRPYYEPPGAAASAQPSAPQAPWFQAPGAGAPGPSVGPTVEAAREALGAAPRAPRGPWERPTSGVPNIPLQRPAPFAAKEPSDFAIYGAPAAIGAGGVALGANALQGSVSSSDTPGLAQQILQTYTGGPSAYTGPGVSADQSDMQPGNYPWNPMGGVERPSDLEPPVSAVPAERFLTMPGQEQRFRPSSYEGQAQRFNPNPVSAAQEVVSRAQNTPTAQAQRVANTPLPPQRPEELRQQPAQQGQQGSALVNFIRGDFREGADQRIQEALRRQREESGVTEGRATGGAAPKKMNRDEILHKALEIIQHMLTRR